jgi:predicted nucleotidyltransferase
MIGKKGWRRSKCFVPDILPGSTPMLNRDFKELLSLFNDRNVEYIVVGGYAVAIHGHPRYTGDLDIWIDPTEVNALKILSALDAFGFGSLGLSQGDFTTSGNVIQLGYPPVRVDILTSIDGIDFSDGRQKRFIVDMDGIQIPVIAFDDLIRNKTASGRFQDLADIEALTN